MYLQANTDVPLYQQVYTHLRHQIKQERLPAGMRLPSERQIAARYGINRQTVRKAFALLAQHGYVIIEWGKGVFVRDEDNPSNSHNHRD